MALKNYLYFAKEAPDGGAVEDVIMIDADSIAHFEMKDQTKLHIFLRKGFGQEFNQDSDAINNILVGITITSGKHKEVLQCLTGLCTSGALAQGGFTVVADSENSVFVHPHIKSCNVIEVIDAA
jgi:hypothetical protein|tara:strand:+ start:291 stop:662 length:372 start_codon:yes stop_codon:yes gene_type:complete